MKYVLPALPYAYGALEPFIDEKTMQLHHLKHHQGYVGQLNKALAEFPEYADLELNMLLRRVPQLPENIRMRVRNHGGGHANHSLFWTIMNPAETSINAELLSAIVNAFGSYEAFQTKFIDAALGIFGSGWGWLLWDAKERALKICTTANQDSPYMEGNIPLLGVDVWEHAYYLQYQNRRLEYIQRWFSLIDWHVVCSRYASCIGV